MDHSNKPAPRLGGSALWFVGALLRAPVVGAALARFISRDVVDGRLRHPDLVGVSNGANAGPAPFYTPPPPPPASAAEVTSVSAGLAHDGGGAW